MKHEAVKKMVKHAYKRLEAGKHVAIFIWGAMGIGKSYLVREAGREIAEEKGLRYTEDITNYDPENEFLVIDIRLSMYDPSDLKGIPSIEENGTVWNVPKEFPRKGQGIIFLDELNQAPTSVQNAAYQLILDRRIGNYKVPDGFLIVCAGNPEEYSSSIFDMPEPLRDRFVHVTLDIPSYEDWLEWAVRNGIDSRILAFIQRFPNRLFTYEGNGGYAFATPRSWERLSWMIEGVDDLELIRGFAEGLIGDVANEFIAFVRRKKEVPELEMIANNIDVLREMDSDVLALVMMECVEKAGDKRMWDAIVKVTEGFAKYHVEYFRTLVRLIKKKDARILAEMSKSEAVREAIAKIFREG